MKLDVKELIAKLTNTPMVVESGTSGIWTYRKWSSGIAELWGYTTDDIPAGWSPVGIIIPFPFTLTAFTSWNVSQGNYQISRCYLNISTTQIAIQTYSDSALNALFAFEVKGRWK